MSSSMLSSTSTPTLPSLEVTRSTSGSSMPYSTSAFSLPTASESPAPSSPPSSPVSPLSPPSTPCSPASSAAAAPAFTSDISLAACYIQCGKARGTGLLSYLEPSFFLLCSHRLLPDALVAAAASATFCYQSPSPTRVTLCPSSLFLTSPPSLLDFTLVGIAASSLSLLQQRGLLTSAFDLAQLVSRQQLSRGIPLSVHQHLFLSPLSSSPGYLLALYDGWFAYSAASHSGCLGGLVTRSSDGQLLGLHRGRNDSRRWSEGTPIADMLPHISVYLQTAQQSASAFPLRSWLRRSFSSLSSLSSSAPPSPAIGPRVLALTPPCSPKGEALLPPAAKRSTGDRIVVVFVLLCLLCLTAKELAKLELDTDGSSSGSRWLVNALGAAAMVAAQLTAYAGWRRWKNA